MSARVEIEGLSRAFGGRPALSNVSLTLEPGTTTTLVGASGSGKTTLLRCLAGLLRPDSGTVRFDGEDVTFRPAERRGVGLVFQSYALFPHLTVAGNIAFGLDVRRVGEPERGRRVVELARELGIEALLDRRPSEISGGERQRVALGRALAYSPVLLLLDEPLAALDPNLAETVREALARAIAAVRTTVLLVTHDRSDALRLGDRVVLLREGSIEQVGTPRELYRQPKTEYAAHFFGVGATWDVEVVQEGGSAVAHTPLGTLPLNGASAGRARLVIRPEALSIAGSGGLTVRVRRVSYEGDRSRIVFEAGGAEALLDAPGHHEIRPGDSIPIRVDPALLIVLPPSSTAR